MWDLETAEDLLQHIIVSVYYKYYFNTESFLIKIEAKKSTQEKIYMVTFVTINTGSLPCDNSKKRPWAFRPYVSKAGKKKI